MSEKDKLIAFIFEEGRKIATRWVFAAVFALALMLFEPINAFVKSIIELPHKVDELTQKLAELDGKVTAVSGESRVIYEEQNLSFVSEPVYLGEQLVYTFIARRTARGEKCLAISYTPVFSDEDSIIVQGESVKMTRQLLTGESAPVRLRMKLPEELTPGRHTVRVSFEYQCDGKTEYDMTLPVAFRLLERFGSTERR